VIVTSDVIVANSARDVIGGWHRAPNPQEIALVVRVLQFAKLKGLFLCIVVAFIEPLVPRTLDPNSCGFLVFAKDVGNDVIVRHALVNRHTLDFQLTSHTVAV